MFANLTMAPPDPILGLTEAFNQERNPAKINLGVGVYQDDSGKTPVFSSVKKAEKRLLEQEATKNYLPISGSPKYAAAVQQMLFGAGHSAIDQKRAATIHAPGGTGALRVAGDFLKQFAVPGAKIWVSDPTWSNHIGVFQAAGFEIGKYPYYDASSKGLDFEAMIKAMRGIPKGHIPLLHACCHNPSGIDPDMEQWSAIAAAVKERELIPLFDFAYQGLAHGIEEDAAPVRMFADLGVDMLVASSFSKNFGLYNERVGALTVVADSADSAEKALSHMKTVVRANFSNPPSHGGAIVETILSDPELKREWEGEVAAMRDRIRSMRERFVKTLAAKGVDRDFSFIARQNGMFSFSGLTEAQVKALRDRYAIYIVSNGRINVAGMTSGNIERLCEAIADVLK
ncbi:MAG: Aspartate aminotransferase [candidate division BRC1 bacterium ADurb.BinA364]|nr:MAG: Aspartate aminotransferase [candidate division BRC1 bacterium ADurb.BinA364]